MTRRPKHAAERSAPRWPTALNGAKTVTSTHTSEEQLPVIAGAAERITEVLFVPPVRFELTLDGF
jgi:hypothetical protein